MATVAARTSARTLALLVIVAILFNYIDRGSIGIAAPLMKEELRLSATTFGLAVSAFFWIYAPIQLFVGWVCDRFSVYRLYALGMVLCAVSTLLTGLTGDLGSLIFMRILLGLGESFAFPGAAKIITRHVPARYRGVVNGSIAAAQAIGPAIGTLVGGLIMAAHGWRAMFFAFGVLTLVWLAPWQSATRPVRRNATNDTRVLPFPIAKLLRYRALWALSAGHFIFVYIVYFVLTWLPLYLVRSRGYSLGEMSLLVTLVYCVQAVSALVTGWASDRLVAFGRSEGKVRKTLLAIGQAGLALAIVGIAFAADFRQLVACLIAAGLFLGLIGGNIFALSQMFSGPRAAGSWTGVQNMLANLAGILGPIITGLIVDRTGTYTMAFVITAAVGAFGALWWCLAVPSVEQVVPD